MSATNIGDLFDFSRKGRGGGQNSLPDRGVMVSVGKAKDRFTVCFGLGQKLMAHQRWQTGDRLTVDIDKRARRIALRVVSTDDTITPSWKLTTRNGGKCEDGVCAAASLKLTAVPGLLAAIGMASAKRPYIQSEVSSGPLGVSFAMPTPADIGD